MRSIRNWKKFQHFKDRRPPWIKLYRDLLDDPDWHELDGDDAKSLMMLWLIASEDEGRLPGARKLAFRLRMTEAKVNQLLNRLSNWLTQDDIEMISGRYQDDTPETETETETETELRAVAPATRPDGSFEEFWKSYPKRDGANPRAPARKKFLAVCKSGIDAARIIAGAIRYRSEAQSKQQIGTPYVAQAVTWLNQQRWEDYTPDGSPSTGPPQPPPGMPTDAELRAKYARSSNGNSVNGSDNTNNILGEGARPDSEVVPGQRAGIVARNTGARSLGSIFRQSPALAAICPQDAGDGANSRDDGPDAMARVV